MTDFPQIECKKHAYRQTQDGVVISFVVHPNDITPELASAALGTRYMIVVVELNDNETAKPPQNNHKLAMRASILCEEPSFRTFLWKKFKPEWDCAPDEAEAAELVRGLCGVKSRGEFDRDPEAASRWRALSGEYEAWKVL